MKGFRVIVISFLVILYTALVVVSFWLKIDFLLVFLAAPWSMFITIVSGIFHSSSNIDYWFIAGAFLNLILFLWLFLLKPILDKSFEIPD